jgi:glycosyltransferase involved in cell wall biosynthesis
MNAIKKILYKHIVEPFTLRKMDFVYCVCNYASNRPVIKKNARKLLNTIHTGIMPVTPSKERSQVRNELSLPQDKLVGIIVSRIVRDKGYEELSEVIKRLYQRGEDRIRFCIVGEGSYASELNQKLNRDISTGYVRLCGRRDDVVDLLFASDFFILPSWHENFPISLLEAGQAGLPAIATPVGGIPEIIDHEQTGLLVSANSPILLTEAVDRFLDNPEQISWMGRNAKEKIEKSFSLNTMMEKIHGAYFEILNQSYSLGTSRI